ncbi:MAG: PqqD family protein [Bacteroidales bacterium]
MNRLKKNIAISETGFLFDPGTGDSFHLNATGQEILGMIKEGKNKEEIVEQITTRYDVAPNAFEQYYYDFVSMLKHFQITEEHGED